MALYEFLCELCGNITEKKFPITTTTTLIPCSHCAEQVDNVDDWTPYARRIISRSNFHLKGPGWSNQYKPNTSVGSDDEPYKASTPWVEPR